MAMYQHILVALELGKDGPLLDKAQQLAQFCDARISLLHVVEYPGLTHVSEYPVPEELEMEERMLSMAEERLGKLAGGLACTADIHVRAGSPKYEIDTLARSLQVDLILLGSHGRHGLQLLLGSTANGVLHLAGCDVLAVRISD
jgi:universal stress protein A